MEYSKSWFVWHWMMQDALLTLLWTNRTMLSKQMYIFSFERENVVLQQAFK
jgi:hypothetical protein